MSVITRPAYEGQQVKRVKIHKSAVQVWLENGCTIYSTSTERAERAVI